MKPKAKLMQIIRPASVTRFSPAIDSRRTQTQRTHEFLAPQRHPRSLDLISRGNRAGCICL